MASRLENTCAPERTPRTGDDASAVPVRTCVGCRHKVAQPRLRRLRVTASGEVTLGDLVPTGRGAWVHPDPDCVRQAQARGGFARAFRAQVTCDVDRLITQMGLATTGGAPRNPQGRLREGKRVGS